MAIGQAIKGLCGARQGPEFSTALRHVGCDSPHYISESVKG